jgi:hypothetical protein
MGAPIRLTGLSLVTFNAATKVYFGHTLVKTKCLTSKLKVATPIDGTIIKP